LHRSGLRFWIQVWFWLRAVRAGAVQVWGARAVRTGAVQVWGARAVRAG
jgi:hypothetical protein